MKIWSIIPSSLTEIMSESDVKELQEDLKSLVLWQNTWLLKFSLPKCHVSKLPEPQSTR